MKSIIIAAPMSGSGKTTVTLGIMACLKQRGLAVAPFKVGPDFIDPGWHRTAAGHTSINLDGWMCPEGFVRETFFTHAQGADIAVIEGVMGLFDGMSGTSDAGSSAQIARILEAPVILVIDAKSQARSAAALINGFAGFDPQVHIAGVIFNNVGSDNHAGILKQAVASCCPGIRVLGCIPRDERLAIPSRHLGLKIAEESPSQGDFLEYLAAVTGKHVQLDEILSFGDRVESWPVRQTPLARPAPVRIAVARDLAFCFVYEDNLRLLREAGAELVEFSPLGDRSLPEGIGGIYLPGGYPELHAAQLASNLAMKTAISTAIENEMPVYAECGGFIYLTGGVIGPDTPAGAPKPLPPRQGATGAGSRTHEFVGIFPVQTRMLAKRKALGYRQVELLTDSPIAAKGAIARGHEFHYSEMEEMPEQVERVYRVSRNGSVLGNEGYRHKNCLASYLHLHFGSCPEIASTFVANCKIFERGYH